jgi:hypothetical protein
MLALAALMFSSSTALAADANEALIADQNG